MDLPGTAAQPTAGWGTAHHDGQAARPTLSGLVTPYVRSQHCSLNFEPFRDFSGWEHGARLGL